MARRVRTAMGSGGDRRAGRPAHGHAWCGTAARAAHPVGRGLWSATADQAGAASVYERTVPKARC